MANAILLIKLVVLCCIVMTGPYYAEAADLSCGTVTKNIAQCVSYLKGTGTTPSKACCDGVTALKNLASTPADRKTACGCLKSAASSVKGLDNSRAAGLPGQCDVTISYSISPNTDCSKVN